MKKWIFVVGIVGCSLLFFLSGTLIGYSVSSQTSSEKVGSTQKIARKPSENINPVIGRIVRYQALSLDSRTRIPTPDAVVKAQQYKSKLMG